MDSRREKEGGFTLIEVLASIIILSIASLTMTAFFNNAMSYNKGNENKTVLVNIARNTLVYMEKQNFDLLKAYFTGITTTTINNETTTTTVPPHPTIVSTDCKSKDDADCGNEAFKKMFIDWKTLSDVLNPIINGIHYKVTIKYQEKIVISNDANTDTDKKKLNKYLLPIIIQVSNLDNVDSSRHLTSEVEGYITSESIR